MTTTLPATLLRSDLDLPGVTTIYRGKVRDVYTLKGREKPARVIDHLAHGGAVCPLEKGIKEIHCSAPLTGIKNCRPSFGP